MNPGHRALAPSGDRPHTGNLLFPTAPSPLQRSGFGSGQACARSLVEPGSPWAGFTRGTVDDWLDVLAACQPQPERDADDGVTRRTATLALLRSALLGLLATDDEPSLTAAVHQQLALARREEHGVG
ncbi:TetR family transcriptional regulator [Streptomyces sp. NPDC060322]|uniref:TetR family transcriptional regulator n=1 Tax=Streptomyces sp. NPDC060322 TaxID=3347097 RepID=UPI003659098D